MQYNVMYSLTVFPKCFDESDRSVPPVEIRWVVSDIVQTVPLPCQSQLQVASPKLLASGAHDPCLGLNTRSCDCAGRMDEARCTTAGAAPAEQLTARGAPTARLQADEAF